MNRGPYVEPGAMRYRCHTGIFTPAQTTEMRWSLRRLRACTAPRQLDEAIQARIAASRAKLLELSSRHTAKDEALYEAAVQSLLASYNRAGASSALDALEFVEAGFNDATETLRDAPEAVRFGRPTQTLLSHAASSIIAQRALTWRLVELERAEASELILKGQGRELLQELLTYAIDDARAFCREKFGDAPEMEVHPSDEGTAAGAGAVVGAEPAATDSLLFPSSVVFGVHEILKNAMGAHVRRVGADRLSRLPPIEVTFGDAGGFAHVRVRDHGMGLAEADGAAKCLRFLHTTNPPREATYTYSRNFGAPFEGLGMGLSLARRHALFLGGDLQLASMPGEGVDACLLFDSTGELSDPDPAPGPPRDVT